MCDVLDCHIGLCITIASNIHKAVSPEAYVDYCKAAFNETPTFFYMIKGHEVPDLRDIKSTDFVEMELDESIKDDLYVVYLDTDRMSYNFYHKSTSGLNCSERSRHPFVTVTDSDYPASFLQKKRSDG